MLKKSDYFYIVLSFMAIIIFYIYFSANISTNAGDYKDLPFVSIPKNNFSAEEYNVENAPFIVLCGKQQNNENTQNIIKMLSELKISYSIFSTVDEISSTHIDKIETVLITANNWEEIGNKDLLIEYASKYGKNIVFTDILEEENGEYNKKIGILKNGGQTNIDGIMIFKEMFIQGMVYYNKLNMNVKDIKVDARCKKLAAEWTKEKTEQRDLIPLIWRKIDGKGCYYVVNGDLLASDNGIGIMTGLLSQMYEDFIYPVVNAKTCLLDSFPELDNEYENKINELYSRDTNKFIRDIVWPSLVKLGQKNNLIYSARPNEKISENAIMKYEYIKKMMKKWKCEIEEETKTDNLELPYVCSGHEKTSKDTYNMQSSVSGRGYAAQYLDMTEIMGRNADNPEYEWSKYSLELSKKMFDIYHDTDWTDALPLSQARERYKRYMLIKPYIVKTETSVRIDTDNFNEICFYIIRTDKKIVNGDGYEAEKIGDNAYLIKVFKDSVSVSLEVF